MHFRSDAARVAPNDAAVEADDLRFPGTVAQTLYVGQGYRYRVHTDGADVWAHAFERMPEGAAVAVVVPRSALLVFSAAALIH